jgi:hypothetical protein
LPLPFTHSFSLLWHLELHQPSGTHEVTITRTKASRERPVEKESISLIASVTVELSNQPHTPSHCTPTGENQMSLLEVPFSWTSYYLQPKEFLIDMLINSIHSFIGSTNIYWEAPVKKPEFTGKVAQVIESVLASIRPWVQTPPC